MSRRTPAASAATRWRTAAAVVAGPTASRVRFLAHGAEAGTATSSRGGGGARGDRERCARGHAAALDGPLSGSAGSVKGEARDDPRRRRERRGLRARRSIRAARGRSLPRLAVGTISAKASSVAQGACRAYRRRNAGNRRRRAARARPAPATSRCPPGRRLLAAGDAGAGAGPSTSRRARPSRKYSWPRWRSPGSKCEAARLNSGSGCGSTSVPGGRAWPRRRVRARTSVASWREGVGLDLVSGFPGCDRARGVPRAVVPFDRVDVPQSRTGSVFDSLSAASLIDGRTRAPPSRGAPKPRGSSRP